MRTKDNHLVPLARGLRRNSTLAEARLWEQLRGRKLEDIKFVRQERVGPFIADFACRELKLIVEVDGATHSTEVELAADKARTLFLNTLGYEVIRVTNEEVLSGLDQVVTMMREIIRNRPRPAAAGRGKGPGAEGVGKGEGPTDVFAHKR